MILWARVIRARHGVGYDVRGISGGMSIRAVGEQSPPLTREERAAKDRAAAEWRMRSANAMTNAMAGRGPDYMLWLPPGYNPVGRWWR